MDGFSVLELPCIDVRFRRCIKHRVCVSVSANSIFAACAANSVYGVGQWNDQYGRDLENIGWNRDQRWPIYGALIERDIHRNCDQFSGFHQVGFRNYHGLATHSGIDFRFSRDSDYSNRRAATIHRDDLRDEQHSGDVDGIWWHNHDEWTVHSADSRGYLHGHGRKRSKQFDVRFC